MNEADDLLKEFFKISTILDEIGDLGGHFRGDIEKFVDREDLNK